MELCSISGTREPRAFDKPVPLRIDDSNPRLKFETNVGSFLAELFLKDYPITCSNIIDLVEKGFYTGQFIHRVVPNFGLQFGCPFSKSTGETAIVAPTLSSSSISTQSPYSPLLPSVRPPNFVSAAKYHASVGRGGPEAHSEFVLLPRSLVSETRIKRDKGGNIPDEFTTPFSNEAFSLAMANVPGQPNSGGSQIFINFRANPFLDWFGIQRAAGDEDEEEKMNRTQQIVFGLVVEGIHVLRNIEAAALDCDFRPIKPIEILSVKIENPP